MYKYLLIGCTLLSTITQADEIHVGSVLNFIAPLEEVSRLFEKSTGHKIIIHPHAMGKIYNEAVVSPDLDIVLLADSKSAQKLEANGVALQGSRFTYAVGKLALWSNTLNLVDAKGEVLKKGDFKRLALPDTQENPYGIAAYSMLDNSGLLAALEPKFLITATVVDSRQQVLDGKAELAFTALSVLNPHKKIEGSVWIIPKKLYPALEQQVVLLKRAENDKTAQIFLKYLKSSQARNVIEKYGYSLP